MKKPHEDWYEFAKSDLAFARCGLKDGFYAHVCNLSQQAVEKAMKGYLVFCGKNYPRTHGLVALYRSINANWLEDYLVELKKLSEFYIPVRYPDAIAGALSSGLPNKEDAKNALNWAEEIVKLIEKHSKSI